MLHLEEMAALHPIRLRSEGFEMSSVDELRLMVENLSFRKHQFSNAERQLIEFADLYRKLDPSRADQLRSFFDSKDRLGLFRTAASLFRRYFPDAVEAQKTRLFQCLFATYSFDNLGFGYDSVLDIIDISSLLEDQDSLLAKETWLPFKGLTTNQIAASNLENHLLGDTIAPAS